jgi:hypothetical protein
MANMTLEIETPCALHFLSIPLVRSSLKDVVGTMVWRIGSFFRGKTCPPYDCDQAGECRHVHNKLTISLSELFWKSIRPIARRNRFCSVPRFSSTLAGMAEPYDNFRPVGWITIL